MKLTDLQTHITELFGIENLEKLPNERIFRFDGVEDVRRIGYCTNLTPETVDEAIKARVNVMITHHDAYDFMYGMKEVCLSRLQEHGISHCQFHLPLDGADDFGNNVMLARKLGARVVERSHLEADAFYCGRICEFDEPLTFDALKSRLEAVLDESVHAWRNHDRPIKRIGIVTGGGLETGHVKEAADKGCDAYITGERALYTIEYARFAGIDLFIGSHTFTELFGVEEIARRVRDHFGDVEVIRLPEEHLETSGA